MKKLRNLAMVLIAIAGTTVNAQTEKLNELRADAQEAKSELLQADSDLQTFFDNAAGYVIFPNVGKGGLIIGGASGNGIVYENGNAIGKAGLKKLNIGLQAGGQSIIEVIFFETEDDLKDFKEGNFSFGAEASAVAVKSGVAVNAKYKNGVAVFALPKAGLMANASVGGQKFSYDGFESDMK
ncbi:hypothetical protein MTsPCn5_00750 [Croceitalea sp. MTPC5]|uniref:lipid-binding SYLF domain-containing protein n=1 Tax=Croceitalea sp. MTPC5 TaxID=3056565 RepID=UPI002B3C3C18|nr:hypothetical protein MTsPCn5_00750 [Croceitalea sp. MTPC5]